MANTNANTGANIYAKLLGVQTELKAPKSQYNNFGKYSYRSAEDILEAVKPLLAKYNCALFMEDNIVKDGVTFVTTKDEETGRETKQERPDSYLEATAHFIDIESGAEITTRAHAKICEHKGMTADQCTGTASSYARKYCLNGLFLIDDTKDADTDYVQGLAQQSGQRGGAPAQGNAPAPAQGNPVQWGQQGGQPQQNGGKQWGRR